MSAIPFANNIDLSQFELQNAVVQVLGSNPSAPVLGQIYFNSSTKRLRQYNGTGWVEYGDGSGTGDVSSVETSSVDNQLVLFNSATGKVIKKATFTGLVKLASGAASAAVAGTDYTTPSSTETFTNKSFDANGSGNSITNLELADFASGVVNNDANLAGATNSQILPALNTKNYIDTKISAAVTGLFNDRGNYDASVNTFPASGGSGTAGAIMKGDIWTVSVAGTLGGVAVAVGDTVRALVDTPGQTASNWALAQANVDRATTTTLGLAEYSTQAEAEAKTSTTVALTPASIVNFPQKKIFTIGDGAATDYVLTHNLNTKDVTYSVRNVSDDKFYGVLVEATSNDTVTVKFGSAPATSSFVVIIIG